MHWWAGGGGRVAYVLTMMRETYDRGQRLDMIMTRILFFFCVCFYGAGISLGFCFISLSQEFNGRDGIASSSLFSFHTCLPAYVLLYVIYSIPHLPMGYLPTYLPFGHILLVYIPFTPCTISLSYPRHTYISIA